MTGNEATGGARSFRFGVVAPLRTDLPAWRDQGKYSEMVWLPTSRIASTSANANRLTGLPNTYRPGAPYCRQRFLDTPDARRSAVAASARSHPGCRGDSRRPTGGYVGIRLSAAHALEYGVGSALTVGAY